MEHRARVRGGGSGSTRADRYTLPAVLGARVRCSVHLISLCGHCVPCPKGVWAWGGCVGQVCSAPWGCLCKGGCPCDRHLGRPGEGFLLAYLLWIVINKVLLLYKVQGLLHYINSSKKDRKRYFGYYSSPSIIAIAIVFYILGKPD